MINENIEKFISALADSLEKQNFVKMTLGNYKGADEHLQKILIRLVEVKKGERMFFLYRYDMRDTAKNFEFAEGVKKVSEVLGKEFFNAHLFTTENDFQLEIGKKNKSRLNIGKPTFKQKPSVAHNREKETLVAQDAFFLQALGVTTDKGEIKEKMHDKWKQIKQFISILSNLVENSNLKDKDSLKIVDMGSGKGYLTFATYDYFANVKKINVEVIGVDRKTELIGLCNDIAKSCEFNSLKFINGAIEEFKLEEVDILIALHACNTATDEAIFAGISANAELIVCAPCCHQQIRPQMKPPELLKNILKHGVMIEREAELITDGIRGILLEKSGYTTKMLEFVPTEHTPKNNMLIGTKHEKKVAAENYSQQLAALKEFYGIKEHRLEKLLENPIKKSTDSM